MKKVIKKAFMLSACLLTASVMWATVIGGGTTTTSGTAADGGSVAGCDDKKSDLKKLNCIAKDGGPAYGCSTLGTLEACTTVAACP